MNELDNCPLALQSNSLNIKNHLSTIEEYNLGPADPRQPNNEFWAAKAVLWGVPEGDARGRLCANCEYYYNTSEIEDCIDAGPAKNLKASALPLTPKWADIESKPVAYCEKFDITCSPVRTCDAQEMGGPMDDERVDAEEESKPAINIYINLNKSSIDDTTEELK